MNDQGEQGPRGDRGREGDQGATGQPGAQGDPGPAARYRFTVAYVLLVLAALTVTYAVQGQQRSALVAACHSRDQQRMEFNKRGHYISSLTRIILADDKVASPQEIETLQGIRQASQRIRIPAVNCEKSVPKPWPTNY